MTTNPFIEKNMLAFEKIIEENWHNPSSEFRDVPKLRADIQNLFKDSLKEAHELGKQEGRDEAITLCDEWIEKKRPQPQHIGDADWMICEVLFQLKKTLAARKP